MPEDWTPFVDDRPEIGQQPDELAFADDSDEPSASADSSNSQQSESPDDSATEDAAPPTVEAQPSNVPLGLMLLAGLVLILGGLGVITKFGASATGTKKP